MEADGGSGGRRSSSGSGTGESSDWRRRRGAGGCAQHPGGVLVYEAPYAPGILDLRPDFTPGWPELLHHPVYRRRVLRDRALHAAHRLRFPAAAAEGGRRDGGRGRGRGGRALGDERRKRERVVEWEEEEDHHHQQQPPKRRQQTVAPGRQGADVQRREESQKPSRRRQEQEQEQQDQPLQQVRAPAPATHCHACTTSVVVPVAQPLSPAHRPGVVTVTQKHTCSHPSPHPPPV
ncbi:hypothetical protein Agub_g469 [Astrephomene gubernaculifera]|uniref:Uncharacterized protein n=1 Tax=Astrephomene gubernaculifera TaxID=47775 RepID=A0AAD3DET8_9CHLO|nr:hypothetical protein Agub_g469 [Astrephomene gubernaculifera]